MTKVSIIIPVYNVEKYLEKCLISLINQTLKEIEIICVNDGSTDNSRAILEQFQLKDKRIKILNQENLGVSQARNNGINIAQGEYIGFVDSDDYVDNDYFEKLYNSAKKFNAEVAAGDLRKEKNNKIYKKRFNYKKEELFIKPADKIKNAYIPKYNYTCNKIYKRDSLLNLNLPFENGRYYEDILWSVKAIYYLKGFVTVPNTYYFYNRNNENSICHHQTTKYLEDKLYADQELLSFLVEHNIPILLNIRKSKYTNFKFLGITVLKLEHYYPNTTKYKLFGFLTLLSIEKS